MYESWKDTLDRIDRQHTSWDTPGGIIWLKPDEPLPPVPEPKPRSAADEIAEILRVLTYSEMMQLANEIWTTSADAGCTEINALSWPSVLILWAHSRQKGTFDNAIV